MISIHWPTVVALAVTGLMILFILIDSDDWLGPILYVVPILIVWLIYFYIW